MNELHILDLSLADEEVELDVALFGTPMTISSFQEKKKKKIHFIGVQSWGENSPSPGSLSSAGSLLLTGLSKTTTQKFRSELCRWMLAAIHAMGPGSICGHCGVWFNVFSLSTFNGLMSSVIYMWFFPKIFDHEILFSKGISWD